MVAKKTLALFLFLSAVCILVVYGFSREEKTFGILGQVKFENEDPAGTVVVYTTGEDSPLKDDKEFIEEKVLNDGRFFRPINELGGKDINIWIFREGYPIIHSTKVLNPNQKSIDFGEVFIPKALKMSTSNVVAVSHLLGYKNTCLEGQPYSVDLNAVKCVRNFSRAPLQNGQCDNLKANTVYNADFLYDSNKKKASNNSPQNSRLYFGL